MPVEQRVEVQHQRRLAGAVGAEHGDALAVGDVEVDPVEAGDAVRVGEAQVRSRGSAQLMPRDPDREQGSGERGQEQRVGAAEGEHVQARHRLAEAAREHRQVHALGALVGAQEQRGGDAADRLRLEGMPGRVAARGERGAHALHLVDDREQVAVHERGDQHEQPRRLQALERVQDVREARGRAEQDGADSVPRIALR